MTAELGGKSGAILDCVGRMTVELGGKNRAIFACVGRVTVELDCPDCEIASSAPPEDRSLCSSTQAERIPVRLRELGSPKPRRESQAKRRTERQSYAAVEVIWNGGDFPSDISWGSRLQPRGKDCGFGTSGTR